MSLLLLLFHFLILKGEKYLEEKHENIYLEYKKKSSQISLTMYFIPLLTLYYSTRSSKDS